MNEFRIDSLDVTQLIDAISAAPEGSTIRLAPGRYLLDREIELERTVTLEGHPGETILDGSGRRSLLRLYGENQFYTMRGLTLQNGFSDFGGAITSSNSNKLMIDQCRFLGNRASTRGGAIFLRGCSGVIARCAFDSNVADQGGGALEIGMSCNVTVDRCVFTRNANWAVLLNDAPYLDLRSSTFKDNEMVMGHGGGGGGVLLFGARNYGPAILVSNTVFAEPRGLESYPGKTYTGGVRNSIVPADLFAKTHLQDLGGNIPGTPEVSEVANGLWALQPGSLGTNMASLEYIDHDAIDLMGNSLVRSGRADPGAIACPNC